ncbi:MAG: DUF1573 domain-containing protein [Desulfobacterales bacterium]|nr:DUF1573 domain-containing protein [Desulfobacterales bacterium]
MRVFLIGCMVLGLAISSFWARPAAGQPLQGPRLVIEETVYDFGKVLEGQVIEHTFKILNKGNAVLHIQKVKPD